MTEQPHHAGEELVCDPAIAGAIKRTMEERVPLASREVYFAEWRDFQAWRAGTNPPFVGPANSIQIQGYLAQRRE
jgi:hypothetical protein